MVLRKAALIFLVLFSFTLFSVSTSSSSTEKISPLETSDAMTEEGMVRGEVSGNVVVFRGIPYAAPPVGPNRWKPPLPPLARSSVLDATKFGSVCTQFPLFSTDGRIVGTEDCLFLNIYTPRNRGTAPLPVMFFIHGGSNTGGSGSDVLYDGRTLTDKGGVVLVTINYRLGPLGYLAHPLLSNEDSNGSSGNYGILDQIRALQWVKRNIRNFGGNPENITIFGESAGGLNVMTLVGSPLAAGLFQKAIAESAAPLNFQKPLRSTMTTPDLSAENFGLRLSMALGCESVGDTLACLRGKTAEELLRVVVPSAGSLDGYGPNVDGFVLNAGIMETLANGTQNNVPLMIGTNKNEGTIFILDFKLDNEADYRAAVRRAFPQSPETADKLVARYPISDYGSPRKALDALITDSLFYCPARSVSRFVAMRQPSTYVYRFNRFVKEPVFLKDLGAFHAFELFYIFNNFSTGLVTIRPTKKDTKLASAMLQYWTNFAKNGDPNGPGLPVWPPYTVNGDVNVRLDAKIATDTGLRKEFCAFLSSLLGTPNPVADDCDCR